MLAIHGRALWDLVQTTAGFVLSLPAPLNVLAMEDARMGSAGDQQPNATFTVAPIIGTAPCTACGNLSNPISPVPLAMIGFRRPLCVSPGVNDGFTPCE